MNENDNPFMSMVEIIRNEGSIYNPVPFFIGVVTSVEPLKVEVNNVPLDRKGLLINPSLLKGYESKVNIKSSQVIGDIRIQPSDEYKNYDSRDIFIHDGTIINEEDRVKVNDKVLMLMSANQQEFVLVCKVV